MARACGRCEASRVAAVLPGAMGCEGAEACFDLCGSAGRGRGARRAGVWVTDAHRGIAADDPRNAGPIEYFRPEPVTRESLRRSLTAILGDKDPADVESRIDNTMQKIARGPIAPNPPVSQSLETVADPLYGLGTHPDIIMTLWHLDDSLPERCRWVFWGGPALALLSLYVLLSIVVRLPPHVIASADPELARVVQKFNRAPTFDIGPAGPEWRLIAQVAPRALWCRAAYDFAAEVAH